MPAIIPIFLTSFINITSEDILVKFKSASIKRFLSSQLRDGGISLYERSYGLKKNKDREEKIKKMRRRLKEEIRGEAKCEMEGKSTLLNVLDILAKACPHMLDVDDIREMLGNEDQDTIKSWLSCLNKKVEKETEEKVLEHVNFWLRDRRMGRDVKIFMVLCVLSIMGFLGVLVYPSPVIPFLSLGHVPIFVVWGITACYFIIITQRYGWGGGSKRLYRR